MAEPKRIRMSRQHPWRADNPDAIIVARPSKYGNPVHPFTPSLLGRLHAVAAFRSLVDDAAARASAGYPDPETIRAELRGRDLACWCPLDQPCHADVLLEIANTDAGPPGSGHSPRATDHGVGDCGGSVEEPSTHLIHGPASGRLSELSRQIRPLLEARGPAAYDAPRRIEPLLCELLDLIDRSVR